MEENYIRKQQTALQKNILSNECLVEKLSDKFKYKIKSDVDKMDQVILGVMKITELHGILCWLNYGALLRMVRENRLLYLYYLREIINKYLSFCSTITLDQLSENIAEPSGSRVSVNYILFKHPHNTFQSLNWRLSASIN